MTFGQERVRQDFNPAGQDPPHVGPDGEVYPRPGDLVDKIKKDTAALIDLLHDSNEEMDHDGRLIALALTAYEEAAMWAVKAVTG